MAKYTVNHSCGHDETVQLAGPGKDRQRKIDWMSGQPCFACRRAAEAAAAEAVSQDLGLPALTGSVKQVAWATKIRATHVAELKTQIAALHAKADAAQAERPEYAGEVRDALALLETEVLGCTDAHAWIEGTVCAGTAGYSDSYDWQRGSFGWRVWIWSQIKTRNLVPHAVFSAPVA